MRERIFAHCSEARPRHLRIGKSSKAAHGAMIERPELVDGCGGLLAANDKQ
jgi:hypothetical protein